VMPVMRAFFGRRALADSMSFLLLPLHMSVSATFHVLPYTSSKRMMSSSPRYSPL
jgi:hypothetical protein